MPIKDDFVYLKHIADAITKIEEYTSNIDSLTFFKNSLIQDGVIRQIEVIGEAAKNLSTTIINTYSQVPWKDIAGMRDKLIHHYFGVDIDSVWATVKTDIPILKSSINNILTDLA